jgi:hypothetical protein
MRKIVLAAVAVVVVGTAAMYLAADHAARNPDSWFGRCIYVAGYIGSRCNPFAGIGAAAARRALPAQAPPVCQAAEKPNTEMPKPPAQAEAEEVSEPIQVEPQPGFIVPLDPDEIPAVPASEETPEPRFGPGEESEVPAAVPAPADAGEEAPIPPVPSEIDDPPACPKCGPCPKAPCDKGCFSWFLGFFGVDCCGKCCTDKAAVVNDEPQEEGTNDQAGTGHDVPDCREDPAYHQQYPSCPYTGCPHPYSYHPAGTMPVESVPGKKPVKKPACNSQPKPVKPCCGDGEQAKPHPDVDTMEARPTDLEKDPFAGVPF